MVYEFKPNKDDLYFIIYTSYHGTKEIYFLIPVKYQSHFIGYDERDFVNDFYALFNVEVALTSEELEKVCDIYNIDIECLWEEINMQHRYLYYEKPYNDLEYIDVRSALKKINI
jgi:hypothetical protein